VWFLWRLEILFECRGGDERRRLLSSGGGRMELKG
jgi:hypothetical protein